MHTHNILTSLLAGASLLVASQTSAAETRTQSFGNNPNWKYHSAFFNNPRRVMDTADKTFFFVHQTRTRQSGWGDLYTNPSGAIFVYDKNDTSKGFQDLRNSVDLSSSQIKYALHNPATSQIVVQYVDGGIDIVNSDNSVAYVGDLSSSLLPGDNNINSILFGTDNNIWVATGSGYLLIDGNTRKVTRHANLGQSVSFICKVGDRVVAVIGDAIYDAASAPASFSNLASTGLASDHSIQALAPLNDNSFIFIGKNGTTAGAALWHARLADGSWTESSPITDSSTFLVIDNGYQVVNRTEGNLIPNKDGYLLYSKNNLYQINRTSNADGSLNFKTRATYSKNNTGVGSWDFDEVWYYSSPNGFYSATASGEGSSTTWTLHETKNVSEIVPFEYTDLIYSDKFGLILTNKGSAWNMSTTDEVDPLLVSTYKNGKWTNLSSCFLKNKPDFTSDASLNTLYESKKMKYPISEGGRYPVIDPAFPDYMAVGSLWTGLIYLNLDNPKGQTLRYSNSKNFNINLPGHKTCFDIPTWATYCGISPGGFDSDNTLWFLYDPSWTKNAVTYNLRLKYWTVDARKAALEAQDVSLSGDFGDLVINNYDIYNMNSLCLALKHPDNKNKVIAWAGGSNRELLIYDHNGTLEDSSDDTLGVVSYFLMPSSGKVNPYRACDLVENPRTGEVLVCSGSGVHVFKPSEAVLQNTIHADNLKAGGVNVIGSLGANTARFDEYGRLWVGTGTDGVYGVSADGSEIFAHYNTKNSPIPSDQVYALAWNPETQSLFISTNYGLAEVKPDYTPEADPFSTTAMVAYPATVTPDHAGTVAIYNVPANASLVVIDSDGKIVANLGASSKNIAFWNLLDNDGRPVKSGLYKISDLSKNAADIEITVAR